MNTEDQELLEIEKMLESMKDTAPAPELRGETLSQARLTWQESSNISYGYFFKWADAAMVIFSIGYYMGTSKDIGEPETTKGPNQDVTAEEFQRMEKNKSRIMKGEK